MKLIQFSNLKSMDQQIMELWNYEIINNNDECNQLINCGEFSITEWPAQMLLKVFIF
jgi:hypothetical protein